MTKPGTDKKQAPPETAVKEEGSSRRNIVRKHDHDPNRKEKKQHGGGGGKGKWNDLDDGSMDE
eukprot:CAMPEP_0172509212 /NCGR_PEP_ID=MMETSP1066-20121228/218374_1 /TAXON_ID=671091 /ORGANISM="Coscinodiscus wailesii, Strain CCMP2513" /LENGTH=62 /DNA_ID=CAMNT_0013287587 /DNA_START=158 /DNA_END=346 /DNA_ORIENTATION=+